MQLFFVLLVGSVSWYHVLHMIVTPDELARRLMVKGRGVLAADESVHTMKKRFDLIGVENTESARWEYRNLLLTTPELESYLSGVILHDETIRQKTKEGVPFPFFLEQRGIMPGIKVDQGLTPLTNFPDEEISVGLDTLPTRLEEYYALGARFTKWRSVIRIDDQKALPTDTAIRANAHVLARYAAIVQSHQMLPMVEPEVLFDGTHTLERSRDVLTSTLDTLCKELLAHRVLLAGVIVKTSMALPGKQSGIPVHAPDVARETVAALKEALPTTIGGVVFLSGGQTPRQATEHLNSIAMHDNLPWPVSFSYSRAIEEPVLEAWRGKQERVEDAQRELLHRLSLNVAAQQGMYRAEME